MKAVIATGGKQYLVGEGERLVIERMAGAQPSGEVAFDQVLSIVDGEQTLIGSPTVSGASVTGVVVELNRRPKVTGVKFHRRRRYLKRLGHKQPVACVEITNITRP